MNDDGKVILCKSSFGKWKNPKTNCCESVDKFTWKTVNRLEVSLITFGASLIEIKAPGRDGKSEDILMGYDQLEDYVRDGRHYFGSMTGPVSGIIKNGRFCVKGKLHQVGKNYKGKHCMNMGDKGFSRVNWDSFVDGNDVILSNATDSSRSFPGIVLVQVIFTVRANNSLIIRATARSNQVTPIDISNQLYFDLGSHDAGAHELLDHLVTVNAIQTCEKNSDGSFSKSNSSNLNLNSLNKVGDIIADNKDKNGIIDCLLIVDKNEDSSDEDPQFVSRIIHPLSGRVLEIYSNQPTLHFSTCSEFPEPITENDSLKDESNGSIDNLTLEYLRTKLTEKEIEFFKCRVDADSIRLSDGKFVGQALMLPNEDCRLNADDDELTGEESIRGKNGAIYTKNSGFSIACRNFPNAVNHQRKHPEILLKPGKVYENLLTLKFGIHVAEKPEDADVVENRFPIQASSHGKFPFRLNSDTLHSFKRNSRLTTDTMKSFMQ